MPRADLPLFLGLDLGTGGARAAVVRLDGERVAQASEPFASRSSRVDGPRHEQDPEEWWRASRVALRTAVEQLGEQGHDARAIEALCVDGTSGTIVGLDAAGAPTTTGLLYGDARAEAEAREWNAAAPEVAIAPTWSLAKLLWLERHERARFAATRHFAHQADFVAGRLCGSHGWSDGCNARKSGFDVARGRWPDAIEARRALRERLPEVHASGAAIERVRPELVRELGLSERVRVRAGLTDGNAAFLASGAHRPGADNTTLGTTLVFKRLATRAVDDPARGLYSHRLPDDARAPAGERERWLPGAASNLGGEWIRTEFAGADLAGLDAEAQRRVPIDALAYPLARAGERFPFADSRARAFSDAARAEPAERFAAGLQGVALFERLAYEALDRAVPSAAAMVDASPRPAGGSSGAEPAGEPHASTGPSTRARPVTERAVDRRATLAVVHATGGGSASDVWMQLRADVCGRTYLRPRYPDTAVGSAVLAAASHFEGGLWEALERMLRIERRFEPDSSRRARYDELFDAFVTRLGAEGWLGG